MVRFSKYVGSVQIELILLKLENYKHCNKIIFKRVNSAVGPILNIFFWIKCLLFLWTVHFVSCIVNPYAWTVQLLFIHVGKKNVKLKMQTRNKPYPNEHVVMLIFLMEVVDLVYKFIWGQTLLISWNELLINALRIPINWTLNYQGQGFSRN